MSGEPDRRPSADWESVVVKPFLRAATAANVCLFRATGGWLGSSLPGGARIGLLTTRGRKSGRPRTVALLYLEDGDRIVLVASQGGMPRDPLWYQNLVADPLVSFQSGASPARYRARRASGEEKARYWTRLCAIYPAYQRYQDRTERDIPVVVLEPEVGS